MAKEKYIEAGRINNTHGVNGELKIEVWVNSPEFLKKCGRVFIDGKPYRFSSAKLQQRFLIAGLEGIEDINSAMVFKGKTVFIDREDAPLKKGSYFLQDLIGCRVETEDGSFVGILEDFIESPANLVYLVRGETEHLIPDVPEFVLSADPDRELITVKLIEGM